MVSTCKRVDSYTVVVGVAFVGISVVLFVYWFWYTCLMILRTRPAHDLARAVVEAYDLGFPIVQETIAKAVTVNVDALQRQLDRDYLLVMRLLHECHTRTGAPETSMLKAYFAILRVYSGATSRLAPSKARAALGQMAEIVGHFAAMLGEQAASA